MPNHFFVPCIIRVIIPQLRTYTWSKNMKTMISAFAVVAILLVVTEHGVAQPSNKTADSNMPLKFFCGSNDVMSPTTFSRNLNSTLSQLRSQLSTGVYFATAQSLENMDAVYGLVQCRNYLLSTECLACFDVAVSVVEVPCGSANGAHVFLDNCFLRWALHTLYKQ